MTANPRPHIYEITKHWLGGSQIEFAAEATVTSTNDLAKNEAFAAHVANEKIYLAGAQTKGRGRGLNTWSAPPSGDALLMTWSVQVERPVQAITGPLLGLAVYRALTRVFSVPNLSIKPPNDVYWKQKKILGILAEAQHQGSHHRLIVGIGLNVFSSPQEIETAGYLAECPAECLFDAGRVTVENWQTFLESLIRELRAAAKTSTESTLSQADCNELLAAIKQHPNGQRYTEILPTADIRISTGETLSWRDL